MIITLAQVTPFMDPPPPSGKTELIESWLTAISAKLTRTFGDVLPPSVAPAVYDIVGTAINRRLSAAQIGADPRIRRQSTGPSSVEYNTNVTALSGWFWPEEANELDELLANKGTITSVRTPAPDGVRYGNLNSDLVFDGDESEYYEGDTPGSPTLVPDLDNPGYYEAG